PEGEHSPRAPAPAHGTAPRASDRGERAAPHADERSLGSPRVGTVLGLAESLRAGREPRAVRREARPRERGDEPLVVAELAIGREREEPVDLLDLALDRVVERQPGGV